jgi:hypothetical protein
MLLKWMTLEDRNIRNGTGLPPLKAPEPTEAATNSKPTSVADAAPSRA